MRGGKQTVVWGMAREVGLAVVTWLMLTTGLYLFVAVSEIGTTAQVLARQRPGGARAQQASVGLIHWLVSFATFNYGWSTLRAQPVMGAIFSSLQYTAPFIVMVLVIGVILGALTALIVRVAEGALLEVPVTGFATIVSAIHPLIWLYAILVVALLTGEIPIFYSSLAAQQGGSAGQFLLRLLMAWALAVPFVGLFARRLMTIVGEDSGWQRRGSLVKTASLEPWLYGTYVLGGVILANDIFAVPGLGSLWINSILQFDLALFFGITGFVTTVFVLVGLIRNLVWVAGDAMNATASTEDEQVGVAATDGGTATDNDTDSAAPSEEGETPPAAEPETPSAPGRDAGAAVGELVTTVVSQPRVLIGGGGFGVLLLAGVLGSAVMPLPRIGFRAGPGAGFGMAAFLHTVGSLATVLAVALVVATVFGVVVGLVAGVLPQLLPRRVGRAIATVWRVQTDVLLAVPLVLLGGLIVVSFGPGERTRFELQMGLAGGALLAAYGFRLALVSAADWTGGELPVSEALPPAAIRPLGRMVAYAPLVGFVPVELALVGFSAPDTPWMVTRLALVLSDLDFTGVATQLRIGVVVAIAIGLPGLCLYLLGDGIEAAADEIHHP